MVVTDAGYGNDTDFRDGVTAWASPYVAGIQGTTGLWPPGAGPLPAAPGRAGAGRPNGCGATPSTSRSRPRRWRGPARGRVADRRLARGHGRAAGLALRRHPGPAGARRFRLSEPRAEEWLLAEWPEGESEPTKYWLSTLPGTATLEELVATAKLRWRVERDFEELKQELGSGHFEGRGWRGFHHHASLCIAAYGFLVAERCRFSPPGWRPRLAAPERPAGYRPRNSPRAPRAAQPGVDRDLAPAPRRRADAPPAALPLLPTSLPATVRARQFMTR